MAVPYHTHTFEIPQATRDDVLAGVSTDKAVVPAALGTAATKNIEDFATAAQGENADNAVQPSDLAAVATSGSYSDLTNRPTLGTAAAQDVTAFATALQGGKADTAIQPADLGTAAYESSAAFATASQGTKADTAIQAPGGTTGQVLTKNSGTDGDVAWQTVAAATAVSYAPQTLTSAQQKQARVNIGILNPPQGRLTLTTGVAITTTDVAGQTTIFYAPYNGNLIPIFDGNSFAMTTFAELSLVLDPTSAHTNYHEANAIFDLFVFNDAGTVRLGTGPKWTNSGAGTSTRGAGAGTTELEVFNGLNVNKNSISVRFGASSGDIVSVSARQATYVGSFLATAAGQASDTITKRLLFNAFNKAFRTLEIVDPTASWDYSVASWRAVNNNVNNQVSILSGLSGSGVSLAANALFVNSTTDYRVGLTGIGINSSTANSAKSLRGLSNSVSTSNAEAQYRGYVGLGLVNFRWIEQGAGLDIQTWRGTNSGANPYTTGLFGEVWL